MHFTSSRRTTILLCTVGLMLVTLACLCGPLQQVQQIQSTVGAAQATLGPVLTEVKQNAPTYEAQMTQFAMTMTIAGPEFESQMPQMMSTMNAAVPGFDATMTAVVGAAGGGLAGGGAASEIRQWASGASATSQLGDPDHSAAQAIGSPGAEQCGDSPQAWASQGNNSIDSLTLTYATPVIPRQINIHEVFNPNSVIRVDVLDTSGAEHTVYKGQPADPGSCPYVMQVLITDVSVPVQTVIITVDQSVIGKRNEINAVELIGKPG